MRLFFPGRLWALVLVAWVMSCGGTRVVVDDRDAGTAVCTPTCADHECGDDGCGGTCGTCPMAAPICTNGICSAACTPDCTGRECGDDGCGGTCGMCPSAAPMCVDNVCRSTCNADCAGRVCGDDGCGGSCGTCNAGDTCEPNGACLPPVGCNTGARQCVDANAYESCGFEQLSSATRTFGPRIPCADGSTCLSGVCGGACLRPEVMLVVDRSQSMIGSKWIYVRQSIDTFVHTHSVSMMFGVRMFPFGPSCAAGTIHAPTADNADFIASNLEDPTSDDETPLAAAMANVRAAFGTPGDGQVVVLITDGEETCATDRAEASREAEVLYRAGVRTYVIAVGPPSNAAALDAIAAAGGTLRHRAVSDGSSLDGVLEAILTELDACGPPVGSGVIGDACADASTCSGTVCLIDGNSFGRPFPGGYCSADCATMACPTGSSCIPDAFNSIEVCFKSCASGADCRTGYDCYTYNGQNICFPNQS